jgi:hypothetical protein
MAPAPPTESQSKYVEGKAMTLIDVERATENFARPVAQDHHHEGAVVAVSPERDPGTTERIRSFGISTDSVVATATVETTDVTSRIEIDWDDGAIDVIRHRPGVSADPALGTNPLPRGTYEVEHVYDVSDDGRAFEARVFVRTDDSDGSFDIRQRRITMTPRYRIVHYPMSVHLGEACDPFPEFNRQLVIKVVLSIDGNVVNAWKWEPSNSFFGPSQRYLLKGSGASMEVAIHPLGQGLSETKHLVFDFTEKDALSPDDKNRIMINLALIAAPEGDVSERIEKTSHGGCEIIYSFAREVTLLKPRKQANPGVFKPS